MYRFIAIIILVCLFSCQTSKNDNKNSENQESSIETSQEVKFDGLILSERIDGPANVRDSKNGSKVYSLNNMTLVECSEIKEDWFYIGVQVNLTQEQFESLYILPNENLYNKQDELIGKTFDTVEVFFEYERSGTIFGYTHKDNIIPESIVENQLMSELNKEVESITFESLSLFMENFGFLKGDFVPGQDYDLYFIHDTYITDPSPRDRVSLIFKNNKLMGISFSRNISSNGWKEFDLVRGHKLLVKENIDTVELEKIKQGMIKAYSFMD